MSTRSFLRRGGARRKLMLGGAVVAVVAAVVPITGLAQAADEAPIILTEDSVVRHGPYSNFQFGPWDRMAVVAVQPAAGEDYDLDVYGLQDGVPWAQSANRGSDVDFAVIPASYATPGWTFATKVNRVSGNRRARIQLTDTQNPFTVAEMPTRLPMKRGTFITAQTFLTTADHPLTLTLAGRHRNSSGEILVLPPRTLDHDFQTRIQAIASGRFQGTEPTSVVLPAPLAGQQTANYVVVFINLSRDGDMTLGMV